MIWGEDDWLEMHFEDSISGSYDAIYDGVYDEQYPD